jgi:hypothetical protein
MLAGREGRGTRGGRRTPGAPHPPDAMGLPTPVRRAKWCAPPCIRSSAEGPTQPPAACTCSSTCEGTGTGRRATGPGAPHHRGGHGVACGGRQPVSRHNLTRYSTRRPSLALQIVDAWEGRCVTVTSPPAEAGSFWGLDPRHDAPGREPTLTGEQSPWCACLSQGEAMHPPLESRGFLALFCQAQSLHIHSRVGGGRLSKRVGDPQLDAIGARAIETAKKKSL